MKENLDKYYLLLITTEAFNFQMSETVMVLTKTRTVMKRPETTYNEQETTWHDLQ